MTKKNIFKASEIEWKAKGWIVDLSPAGIVNPDCYWTFPTRREAREFNRLVSKGVEPREAAYRVAESY